MRGVIAKVPLEIWRQILRLATYPEDVSNVNLDSDEDRHSAERSRIASTFDPDSLGNQSEFPWRQAFKPPVDTPLSLRTKLSLAQASKRLHAIACEFLYEWIYVGVRCDSTSAQNLARFFDRIHHAQSGISSATTAPKFKVDYLYIHVHVDDVHDDLTSRPDSDEYDVQVEEINPGLDGIVAILKRITLRGLVITCSKSSQWSESRWEWDDRDGGLAASAAGENNLKGPSVQRFWRRAFNRLFDNIPAGIEHLEFDGIGLRSWLTNSTLSMQPEPSRFAEVLRRSSDTLQALRLFHLNHTKHKLVPPQQNPISLPRLKYVQMCGDGCANSSLRVPSLAHLSFTVSPASAEMFPWPYDEPLHELRCFCIRASTFGFGKVSAFLRDALPLMPNLAKLVLLPSLEWSLHPIVGLVHIEPNVWRQIRHPHLAELEMHWVLPYEGRPMASRTRTPDDPVMNDHLAAALPYYIQPLTNKVAFPSFRRCVLKSLPYGSVGQEVQRDRYIQSIIAAFHQVPEHFESWTFENDSAMIVIRRL